MFVAIRFAVAVAAAAAVACVTKWHRKTKYGGDALIKSRATTTRSRQEKDRNNNDEKCASKKRRIGGEIEREASNNLTKLHRAERATEQS